MHLTKFLKGHLGRRGFLRGASLIGLSLVALWALAFQPSVAAAAASATPTAEGKIGRHLIGKLEGPTIITDRTKLPKTFKEAPMLAEQVKAGKLPPVDKRLPEEPLVIKPVHEIGKYGGTWRRGFTGPADFENGNRMSSTDKLLFVDYTGLNTAPSVAKACKASDDGRTFTVFLRKGLKWSDGASFTADDITFWYEDMLLNKDLVPIPPGEITINGKMGKVEKIDDYTVAFKFPDPYHLFEEVMRGDSRIGSGLATGPTQYGGFMGGYAPKHYLKQFHPKYVSKEDLDRKVAEAKRDSWVNLLRFKNHWALNPELPVLTPWRTITPINTSVWRLERNPYYWEVDTEGNQLPYIDRVAMTLAENLELLNLRATAGEYDMQSRHIMLAKLPVLLANQAKGGYKVWLDPADYGCDACVAINLTYVADPEIAKWLTNRDFRRALSLGIDRDQLNEVFWMGVGTPGSPVVGESHPYNPGPEYRKLWSTYDPKKANEMLDRIGLATKDAEGYRLRTDGKGRLRLGISTMDAFIPGPRVAEMIREHWRKIGIEADVKELERSLFLKRRDANETPIELLPWGNTGSEVLWTREEAVLPGRPDSPLGPEYGKWYASGGTAGLKPTDPQMLKVMELFRSAAGLPYEERVKVAREIWRIAVDEQWTIGTVGLGPAVMGVRIVKNNMGNVPERLSIMRDARVPGGSHPETYFFKTP